MTPVSLQQHMNGFDAVVDKQLLHVTCGDADQHMRKTQFAATSIVCTGTNPGTPAVEAVPISHNMHLSSSCCRNMAQPALKHQLSATGCAYTLRRNTQKHTRDWLKVGCLPASCLEHYSS